MTQAHDNNQEKGVKFANYAIAFIDILGQKDVLLQFNLIPNLNDQEKQKKFKAVAKNSYGVVEGLMDCCQKYLSAFSRPSSTHLSQISDDKKQAYHELGKVNLKFQRFSDGLVVYTSLDGETTRSAMNDIYGLIGVCGCMCLISLAAGHPIRGGIDIGWGAERDENDLYGGVLAKVSVLEKKVAQYPRIVVGDEIIHYLTDKQANLTPDYFALYNRSLAAICPLLLAKDDDGCIIVDYLGQGFKSMIGAKLPKDVILKAYTYIQTQQAENKYKNTAEKRKRFARYLKLRNYFESRLSIWEITPSSRPHTIFPTTMDSLRSFCREIFSRFRKLFYVLPVHQDNHP